MSERKNPATGHDTGHVWDDNLRELTNQPPRWWMICLYLSALFLVVYFILYPTFPLISGSSKGVLGWTQMKRLNESVADIQAVRAPFENRLVGMSAEAILANPELANYAVRSAKVVFGDRCAPCHGTGGAGNPGYPVLADDDWLYGGSVASIEQSIADGRAGMMPAFAAMLNEQQLDALSQYTLALSKGEGRADGQALFASQGCGGCHGADGKGMPMLGAANLTDAVWRFAPGTVESIKYTISNGVNAPGHEGTRSATMPDFKNQLSATEIKKLAVYVHKLGGGQ